MLEQTTVTIGGDKIQIESLPATAALQLMAKTIKILGGVGKGVQDFPSSLAELQAMGKEMDKYIHLGGMIEGLLDRLDSKEVPELIKSTIKASLPLYHDRNSRGEGSFEEWFENRFSREFGDLFQLLFEIYKYNYGEPVEWLAGFFSATPDKNLDVPDPGPQKQS